ncbi:hypothetical protein OIY81_2904 [Cryptosporidium canis]|uniref:rRNA-processing protein efg1 n=1 Tax=Cryptosporidium canis TaxID=195482 RepID=A0ABQ8P8H7_9CRYT|nr:hypothetical protein OIY81_2904 [Cryptosporidium canis]KAJ1612297.1 hypothetical protein OJ252_1279 [Cryptosporidium canis]
MEGSGSERGSGRRTRSAGKRIRDINRLLGNEKFQISDEKRAELEEEVRELQGVISKNKSSHKKKLDRYLEYKRSKQKTMRFVELVKVKRRISQLQRALVETLNSGESDEDEVYRIKSELIIYKRYEDYIRLLPFFKDRKYIPLFSNVELDSETLERRELYINDVQELKEELRMKKVRSSRNKTHDIRDSFLQEDAELEGDVSTQNPVEPKKPLQKIEYRIQGSSQRSRQNRKTSKNNRHERKEDAKLNSTNYSKSESDPKVNTSVSNHHVIFSDSD